jgi:hypothetical protein
MWFEAPASWAYIYNYFFVAGSPYVSSWCATLTIRNAQKYGFAVYHCNYAYVSAPMLISAMESYRIRRSRNDDDVAAGNQKPAAAVEE